MKRENVMILKIICLLGVLHLVMGTAAAIPIPNEPYPGYTLKEIPLRDFLDNDPLVMGLGFLSDGRMVVSTGIVAEDPRNTTEESAVYIVSGVDGDDFNYMDVIKIAHNFVSTIGVTVVDDVIYISDRHDFYRLTDNENFSDSREKVIDWPFGLIWHHWGFSPVYWEGKFYVGLSGSIVPGGPSTTFAKADEAGSLWEFDLDGNAEIIASGFRQPNGLGMDPYGRIFTTTEQGSWIPSGGLTHIQKGFSYGHRHDPLTEIDQWPYKPYSVYIIYGEDGAARSPGTPRYIHSGPYEGHWLYGDNNHQGIMRVFMEKVNGELQGAVFHFSHGTGMAAINRIEWGPDGALYMGCLGEVAGNWPNAGSRYPMYKLIPTDQTTFDMFAIRSRNNGMEIEFTEPVDQSQQGSWNFEVQQWGYWRQIDYGCCRSSTEGRTVNSVQVSDDGTRVFLQIDGLQPTGDDQDRIVMIRVNGMQAASGTSLWNNIGWYSLHDISESQAFDINGCTDAGYEEYNPDANFDDGTCMIEKIVAVNPFNLDLGDYASIKTDGGITISFNSSGSHSFTIFDLQGRRIMFRAGKGKKQYNLNKLQAGIYYIAVTTERGTFSRKVVLY
jgi:cytochrome c